MIWVKTSRTSSSGFGNFNPITVTLINTTYDFLRDAFEENPFDKILGTVMESNSDVEHESRPQVGRSANINRGREEGASRLFSNYICTDPMYPSRVFERRFRILRAAIINIREALQ